MTPKTWAPGDVAVSRRDGRRMFRVVRVEHDEGDPWPILVYQPCCAHPDPLPPRVSSYWFRHAGETEAIALGTASCVGCVCCLRERWRA